MQQDNFRNGDDAGGGSPTPSWCGVPVRASTEGYPTVATADATGCASPVIPESASSCDHSSSVGCQGSEDHPTRNTAADEVERISTVSAYSFLEVTPARIRTGRTAHSLAFAGNDDRMSTSSLQSPDEDSDAASNKPIAACQWSDDGPTSGTKSSPSYPEPFQTASVTSPASPAVTPAADPTMKAGGTSPTPSPSPLGPPASLEAPAEGQVESQEQRSAVQPVSSLDGELSCNSSMTDLAFSRI